MKQRVLATITAMMTAMGFMIAVSAWLVSSAAGANDDELTAIVEKRLLGDRTNACFAVAVVDDQRSRKTVVCADPTETRSITSQTAFEIGSISKTMTATIVAALVEEGKLSLDDPLSKLLPNASIPSYQGQAILLRHLVTHSSGLPPLPSQMAISKPANPYSMLTQKQLYDSLADVTLTAAPGSRFEYSNFAMMALSHALAEFTGKPFEVLLNQYITSPIGMDQAYVDDKPTDVVTAQGHRQTGAATSAWDFTNDTAGVGGVRASLDDMIAYAKANLGLMKTQANTYLHATHVALEGASGPNVGMNWMLPPLGNRQLIAHEGGTGGFSSLIAMDPAANKAVIILSDTALTDLGGLGGLGMHLMEPTMPLEAPRLSAQPATELLEQLSGDYELPGGPAMTVSHDGTALYVQATGQPKFKMAYDSRGDFYPEAFDAVLRPITTAAGRSFTWLQGGGALAAVRKEPSEITAITLTPTQLADYVGEYPLVPGFSLRFKIEKDDLFVQGTGQQALQLTAIDTDQFVREDVGAHMTFERNDDDQVVAVTLRQGGQTLRGEKQP